MIRYDTSWNECKVDPEGDWVPYEVANELLQALKAMHDAFRFTSHRPEEDAANELARLAIIKNRPEWHDESIMGKYILKAEGLDEPKD